MANRARGETELEVPGVGKVRLCLTMAGMAELEDAFEVDNLEEAVRKVSEQPSSRNMAIVIHALLIGADNDRDHGIEEIRRWKITPGVIREAMSAMNAANEEGEGNASSGGNRRERRAQTSKKG